MKLIEKMTGYKAVDKNMCGRNNYQYELGKLHIHDGKLVMCESGFHFCKYPSGVWCHFDEPETRVFKIEAYDVCPVPSGTGATVKYVAKKIRFIEEIKIDGNYNTGDLNTGHRNTGNYNTGHSNTGHRNTGYYNTGDLNTGHRNTGNYNTGHSNTGHSNTGHRNTGDCNTGDCNTGDFNTGSRNTGSRNTGDCNTGSRNTGDFNTGSRNTGNRNTGIGNATNRSSGFFCDVEPKVLSFNIQTDLTYDEYTEKYPESLSLSSELLEDDPIDFEEYKNIPGITPQKLKKLHNKFKKARLS